MLEIIIMFILKLKSILSLKEIKIVQIPFYDDYSVPLISIKINDAQIEATIDNNLIFNYITTLNCDISDIRYNSNKDIITIKDRNYSANYYNGNLSINFENNNYIINNFHAFVINEKSFPSSIMISTILKSLREELLIAKQLFYLDLVHKKCLFGELSENSKEYKQIYLNNFEKSISYSRDTKGIFKEKLNKFYVGENCIIIEKNVSFKINEEFTYIPEFKMNEISENEKIKSLGCKLIVDDNGGNAILCNKKIINNLPNLHYVFTNFTFNIHFKLLFENYDSSYCISSIRSKKKIINSNEFKEEDDEEWQIGYSIIKLFNYTLFNYDERTISFFSDSLIGLEPYKNKKELFLSNIIFYLLSFILGISSIFLFIIRLKITRIPLEASKKYYNK